ncbi:MAG TPA: cytochrome c5 family protein [Gammaproteobacteria bacterium]|nr:cytochrome c5 family protein [Gammaproteobacteria bacterium]HAU06919.1 cytochrome c5 family protein [Gammaproteobacteria bacterium]
MADKPPRFILGSLVIIISLLILSQVILFNALSLGEQALRDKPTTQQQATPVAQAMMPGEKVVNSVCKRCHAFGMMRAPKLGSERDWSQRVKKGKTVLYQHAINGFKRMPARGDRDLTDQQVKDAVDYMLSLLDIPPPLIQP